MYNTLLVEGPLTIVDARLRVGVLNVSGQIRGDKRMNNIAFLPAVSVFALAAGFTSVTFAQACNPDGGNCRNIKVTVQGNQVASIPRP